MPEIRLTYQCGCVDRWQVVNEPMPSDADMQARTDCRACQDKQWRIPEQALELLAAANAGPIQKPKRRRR